MNTRFTRQRQSAGLEELTLAALIGVIKQSDTTLYACHEVHRAAHTFDHLARYHPISDISIFRHFHRAQHSDVYVPAAYHCKTCCAVEETRFWQGCNCLLARIDQVRIFFAWIRERPHAEHAIFRLQRHIHSLRNVVRHKRRNTNAEIDIESIFKLLRGPRRHFIARPTHDVFSRVVSFSMRFSHSASTIR